MRGSDGKERVETSPTKGPMKTDSHSIFDITKKQQEIACAWHTCTLATYIKATYDNISLFTAIATAGLLCADTPSWFRAFCHSDQPTALQFMVDVSFVMVPLSLTRSWGWEQDPKKEDESDQLLILAVMSTVLTTRYVEPRWALTTGPVHAKQKKHEDIWWRT